MTDKYILNAAGDPEPCDDVLTWARWYEGAERTVDVTMIGDVRVSTVFLGLDHGFRIGQSIPILWETLVFGGPLNLEMDRYATRAQAVEGHAAMVERVRAAFALVSSDSFGELFGEVSEGSKTPRKH